MKHYTVHHNGKAVPFSQYVAAYAYFQHIYWRSNWATFGRPRLETA